jgi:hypothetical protein
MAGFISKDGAKTYGFTSGPADNVRKLSSFGMYYDDLIIQRRQGAGETETNQGGSGAIGHSVYGGYSTAQWDQRLLSAMAIQDIGGLKALAIYDSNYITKRDFLRSFSLNDEVVEILDTISDEAIVYDDKNWFCYPDTKGLESFLSDEKKEEIVNTIHEEFRKLYVKFGFNNNTKAWNLFRQYLVDGFLAFEIVTDEEGEEVIALNKLDPATLQLSTIVGEDGEEYIVWIQKIGNDVERVIYDSSVIYIAYAQNMQMDRVSYVERLVRPLNLLRLIENSKVMWHIMYAQFRLKMTIPIGSNSPQKAKQELSEILNNYKEEIFFNDADGTLSINGRPSIPFFKHFMFPSKDGNSPNVEVIGGQGVDLSNPDFLKYFELKLRRASKIPLGRFGEGGGGTFSSSAEGIQRDEIRFFNFVNRLRSGFQEIMLKPLVLQLLLKYPEFQGDHLFRSSVGIKFNRDNSFDTQRKVETMQKRVSAINELLNIPKTKDDAYFDLDFAMENFMNLTRDELQENKAMIREKEKKAGDKPGDEDVETGAATEEPAV